MKQSTLLKRIGQWMIFLGLLSLTTSLHAQNQTVRGTVTDAGTSEILSGFNIKSQGVVMGTSTNDKGHYEFTVPSLQDIMVFSFAGYKTREIPINGRTTINIF